MFLKTLEHDNTVKGKNMKGENLVLRPKILTDNNTAVCDLFK